MAPKESEAVVSLRLIAGNARLKAARESKGWTRAEMSYQTGIAVTRIQKIESLHIIPSEEDVVRLSAALGVPGDVLFPEDLIEAIKVGVFHKSRRRARLTVPHVRQIADAKRFMMLSAPPAEDDVIDGVCNDELRQDLLKVLKELHPKEQKVIDLRFGLTDGVSRTLDEVGLVFGVTRERIRNIEAKALRSLRHPSRSRGLKDYL